MNPQPSDRNLHQIGGKSPAAQRLRERMRPAIVWLRQPHLKWLRVPVAALFILGGLLGFMPVLGFWMIPIGVVLLVDDIPGIKRPAFRLWVRLGRWTRSALKRRKRHFFFV